MPNFRRKAASTVSRVTQRGCQRAQPTQTAGPSVLGAIEQNDNDIGNSEGESGSEDTHGSSTTASLPPTTNVTTDSSPATTPEPQSDEENWTPVQGRQRNFNHTLRSVIDTRLQTYTRSNASAAPNGHSPPHFLTTDKRSNRGQGKRRQTSAYQQTRHVGSHRAFSQNPRHQEQQIRDGVGIAIAKITPGTILFHREVVVHFNDEQAAREAAGNDSNSDNSDVFQTNSSDWYIEKGRFFFVLNVFANHWTECPIYTYGSRDLHDNMSDDLKNEHIGLKPTHIPAEQYEKQNEYDPIEVTYMKNPNRHLSDKAVIHVTQLRSSNFNTKIEIVGYTEGDSVNKVSALRVQLGCI